MNFKDYEDRKKFFIKSTISLIIIVPIVFLGAEFVALKVDLWKKVFLCILLWGLSGSWRFYNYFWENTKPGLGRVFLTNFMSIVSIFGFPLIYIYNLLFLVFKRETNIRQKNNRPRR